MGSSPHVRTLPTLLGVAAGMIGGLCAASASFAQYSMVEERLPQFEWGGRIGANFQNEFETDTDGGDEFESWRIGVGGDWGGPINESVLVGFQGHYQHAEYDFRLDNGTAPSASYTTNELPKEPWGGIDTIGLTATTTILVGNRFSIQGAVPIRWSGEVGAERNGFAAGISAIASWQIVDSLRVGLGIGVTSQIEGSSETFPLVSLDWQIADTLRFATEGSWIQGGSAALLWGTSHSVAMSFSVGYERNRFRLDDNGTLPDTNGIGEITAVPIEIGVRVHLVEGAYLDLRAGLGVAGRFRVENDRGQKLYDQNYDPAPRLRVALTIPIGAAPTPQSSRSTGTAHSSASDWDTPPPDSPEAPGASEGW
jgi:hypothetical protein